MKAVLLLFVTVLMACQPARSEVVRVPDYMKACVTDEDCVLIETACSACCRYRAINRIYQDEFDASYKKQCTGYQGGVCDCYTEKDVPICIEGLCELTTATDPLYLQRHPKTEHPQTENLPTKEEKK
ncbi:MAG: hypothetical protein IT558_02715 [Alphaproteobacteria bacterium]|nr:hypothetical protein [Alphaproteobacteria bacterium]